MARRCTYADVAVSEERPGREWVIEPNRTSPLTASLFSLGLLLPFGSPALCERAIATLTTAAQPVGAKHVLFVRGTQREPLETNAATVDEFLIERGIVRAPDDRVATSPDGGSLADGATVRFAPARSLTLLVDGTSRVIRTPAETVADVLREQHLSVASHDTLRPAPATALGPDTTIELTHATSWLERIRSSIVAPIERRFDVTMARGTQRVIDPGRAGTQETTVAVLQPTPWVRPRRVSIAARILRFPRAKVVAAGVADRVSLASIAQRGIVGTFRLADAALRMIATAYTASCGGCNGVTASGRPAGHGVVAVDPRYIPLGTRLYIPGYGPAFAGDTGGAIHGNRIDLGFDTHRDALSFGRRAVVVYVLK